MVEDTEPRQPDAPPTCHGRGAVGHGLHWPQNHELLESSIPDLLAVVARNALLVIPAERCVVFMYDKTTNLLSAQVSCDGRVVRDTKAVPRDGSADSSRATADQAENDPDSSDAQKQEEREEELVEEEEELSFPPVMGLVSACFLQRRCLRMQEPNLHKSFHREYDVPKNVAMDSIVVAPVSLHHRTVGVIELLNRIDPDAPAVAAEASPSEELESKNSAAEVKTAGASADEADEVKLTRTTAVQQHARVGFSAKDEQKMIQFTSHVAQLLDNKLKLLAQVESAAKHREQQARTAMELLEMMNQKLEYRAPNALIEEPPRLTKRRSSTAPQVPPVEWTPEQWHDEQTAAPSPAEDASELADEARDQVLLLSEVDMMKVMVGISRTQAVFRGQHLRKVHRLSEALQQHRFMRRRVKSALVIQRATRRFLARRWRKTRRNAIWTMVRAIKSYQLRAALAERIQIKKRQKRERSVLIVETKPREGAHHKLVESDVVQFRERFASAVKIQQQFRGHKARKRIETITGFKDLTKGLKNIVKLQSILRGTMARKQVEKIREVKRTARAANIVCMRLASTESRLGIGPATVEPDAHHAPNSRDCLYPLPALPNGAHIVANRIATSVSATAEPQAVDMSSPRSAVAIPTVARLPHHFRRRRLLPAGVAGDLDKDGWIGPSSRPLAASPLASPRLPPPDRSALLLSHETQPKSGAELMREHPEVVFELQPKRSRRCPAGVQHADDWLPRRPICLKSTRNEEEPDEEDRDAGDASVSTRRGRKRAVVSPAKALVALPQLARPPRSPARPRDSNQLQVCFVPADNARRVGARPPKQQPTTASARRPLTTR